MDFVAAARAELDLAAALRAKGFQVENMGGNCAALVRVRVDANRSDVITTMDGLSEPTADDWMLCTYSGVWELWDGEPPVDSLDGDCSPVSLLEAVDIVSGERDL